MPAIKNRPAPPKLAVCDQCPWRTSNHLTKHQFGFYTKKNLTRLWNQIRNGGGVQSCHLTDPSHEDHVACGARPGMKTHECAGSVILVKREMGKIAAYAPDGRTLDVEQVEQYKKARKKGLTRTGLAYWLVSRLGLGGVPFVGGPVLPDVDVEDKRVSLPVFLEG